MKWIIEDLFDDRSKELIKEVKKQGYECETIRYVPFEGGDYSNTVKDDGLIFQGSIQLALQLQKEKNWKSGLWLTVDNYDCSVYYRKLNKYLFNSDYLFGTVETIKSNIESLFEMIGQDDCLFIRPSSVLKTFTGKVFYREHFEKDWRWVKEFCSSSDLLVVSSPKTILGEWRFIVVNNEIITGCKYKPEKSSGFPKGVFYKAKQIIDDYQPDSVFVVDICQGYDRKYYLLELGSFSVAGLYECNRAKIVSKLSCI